MEEQKNASCSIDTIVFDALNEEIRDECWVGMHKAVKFLIAHVGGHFENCAVEDGISAKRMEEDVNVALVYIRLDFSKRFLLFKIDDHAIALPFMGMAGHELRVAVELTDDEKHGFGLEKDEEVLDEIAELGFPVLVVILPSRDEGKKLAHGFFKDAIKEFFLAAKVIVEGRLADIGFVSNALHAGAIEAIQFKDHFGGLKDLDFCLSRLWHFGLIIWFDQMVSKGKRIHLSFANEFNVETSIYLKALKLSEKCFGRSGLGWCRLVGFAARLSHKVSQLWGIGGNKRRFGNLF
jgi:hypothetical protein